MELIFKNSCGYRRVIAQVADEQEGIREIWKFIEDCNANKPANKQFKSYYTRTWVNEAGERMFDVGSHTEFFYLI